MKYQIFLMLVLSITTPQSLLACFCEEETIESADYKYYDEVFLGKVLNIKRIEIVKKYGQEAYIAVGTETTFEVLKKWKGSHQKIIKIFQESSSCSIDFSITNSRWILGAYHKSFVTNAFKKVYPSIYLQTDNCSLYNEELSFGDYQAEFEAGIKKLDKLFPHSIELVDKMNYGYYWVLALGFLCISLFLVGTKD